LRLHGGRREAGQGINHIAIDPLGNETAARQAGDDLLGLILICLGVQPERCA
jgi:hypothetical protein